MTDGTKPATSGNTMGLAPEDGILTPAGLVATIVMGVIGALVIWMVPALLALLSTQSQLDNRQLGYIAAWDINAMAAAMGIGALLLNRINWHVLLAVGLCLICVGNLATAEMHDFTAIVGARIVAGIGEGLTTGVAFAALGRWKIPDQAFAIYLGVGTFFSAGLLWIFPWMQAHFGAEHMFIGNALMALLAVIGLRAIPNGKSTGATSQAASTQFNLRLTSFGLAGVFFYFLAMGAIWSYFERIGQASGVSGATVGKAMAISTLAGIAGASIAALLPRRWGRDWPLIISGIGSVFSMQMLAGHVGAMSLVIAGVLFTFFWNLSQPLLSGICCDADPSGRVVCAMGCIQTIGYGLGPAVTAMLIIGDTNFDMAIWLSLASLCLSLIIIVGGNRLCKPRNLARSR